ncbi:MAG TPA: DUF4190 domain-containing protein [Verrucomicrobiae bacterium]|jgi:hypothetical protein
MNYRIVGNDGKIYGPVSAEQIRAWIRQNRVESRTPILVEGATEWTFVGMLPEFAESFHAAPPPFSPFASPGNPFGPSKGPSLALWSLICGALAWLSCCCCLPINMIGLVLGIIALVQIQSQPEPRPSRGVAIAGVILSGTNLLWCAAVTLLNLASDHSKFTMNFQ